MSVARPLSRLATATSLWRRAPWWRFTLLCSGLLLLLAALFPPHLQWPGGQTAPAPLGGASYTPPAQPVAAASGPTAAAPPVASPPRTKAARPLAFARVPAVAPVTAPPVVSAPTPAAAPLAPPPQSGAAPAHLSLATPGAPAANSAGIDSALLGRTYQHELLMDGFKVPLPQGEWAILASFNIWVKQNPQNKGTTYFLGRIEKGRLVGALHVNVLRSPAEAPTGFDEFKPCTSPDSIYTNNEGVTAFDHQACWLIHSYFTPPWQQWGDKAVTMDNVVRAAAGDLAAKGVTYPQDLVAVHFYRAEKWGMLNATYLFSPEQDGIQSDVAPTFRDSEWFGPNVKRYPEKVAYTDKLKRWGEEFWPRFKAAFEAGR